MKENKDKVVYSITQEDVEYVLKNSVDDKYLKILKDKNISFEDICDFLNRHIDINWIEAIRCGVQEMAYRYK